MYNTDVGRFDNVILYVYKYRPCVCARVYVCWKKTNFNRVASIHTKKHECQRITIDSSLLVDDAHAQCF